MRAPDREQRVINEAVTVEIASAESLEFTPIDLTVAPLGSKYGPPPRCDVR